MRLCDAAVRLDGSTLSPAKPAARKSYRLVNAEKALEKSMMLKDSLAILAAASLTMPNRFGLVLRLIRLDPAPNILVKLPSICFCSDQVRVHYDPSFVYLVRFSRSFSSLSIDPQKREWQAYHVSNGLCNLSVTVVNKDVTNPTIASEFLNNPGFAMKTYRASPLHLPLPLPPLAISSPPPRQPSSSPPWARPFARHRNSAITFKRREISPATMNHDHQRHNGDTVADISIGTLLGMLGKPRLSSLTPTTPACKRERCACDRTRNRYEPK